MIHFDCPRCAFELQLPDRRAGSILRCPECEERLRVPIAGPTAPEAEVDGVQPAVLPGGSRFISGVVAVLAALPLGGVIAVIALSGFLLKTPDGPGMDGPEVVLPAETVVPAMVSIPQASSVPAGAVDAGMIAP
jgi:hypothetical protein